MKGFLLSDAQLVAVIDLLARNEALFFSSFVDMAGQTSADINRHRTLAIDALAENLTDGHPPELRANVAELQRRLAAFSPQLYIQSFVIIDLLHHVLDQMLMYHAQRHPRELSAFHWVIDAKGSAGISDWEDWWSRTLVVWLQAMSLEDPKSFLIGADYSHFDRFLLKEVPKYLENRAPANIDQVRGAGVDLQLMFGESFRFSSEPEPGLELVDIVTNALRRALRGNISEKTWIQLGRLLIRRTDLNVRAVTMSFDDEMTFRPYAPVVQKLSFTGRDMLTADHRRRLEQRSAIERR